MEAFCLRGCPAFRCTSYYYILSTQQIRPSRYCKSEQLTGANASQDRGKERGAGHVQIATSTRNTIAHFGPEMDSH